MHNIPVRIVDATAADAPALAALHLASWRATYRGMMPDAFLDGEAATQRLAAWREHLAGPPRAGTRVRLAFAGDALTGFVCTSLDIDPRWGPRVDHLHVAPDWQGRGLGRRLLAEAMTWALDARGTDERRPALHLWVLEQNTPARRFYERAGGRPADTRMSTVAEFAVPEVRYTWTLAGAREAVRSMMSP